jgi:serine protease AprX
MPQLIVIPPANFSVPTNIELPGAAFGAAWGEMEARAAVPTTLRGVLADRRRDLIAFANRALASAAGLSHLQEAASIEGAASRSRGSSRGRARTSKAKATAMAEAAVEASPVQLLEALGALIMDDSAVDRTALEGALGATVIENFLVPLEYPVEMGTEQAWAGEAAGALPWHLEDINVQAARDRGLDGRGILAGVVDTGIDVDHPEFADKKIHFAEFDAGGRLLSRTPRDAGTHGTHVCGLIAGATAGVAPKAELAVAAVLTIPGPRGLSGWFAQILGGMNWLLTEPFDGAGVEPGVDLLNASLGGVGYSPFYYNALANARLTTGTVLAAAIGNSGPAQNNHGSPGNYDIVVGVGALDRGRNVASFSDWGAVPQHGPLRKPDLSAPGVAVISSVPGGGYAPMNGTSMASPVTAGALALLLQQDPALSLNANGLIARLFALTSQLSGQVNQMRGGRGRLDLTAV